MGATFGCVGQCFEAQKKGRNKTYTKTVLELHTADAEGLEELGDWLPAQLGISSSSCWGILRRGEIGETRRGLVVDIRKRN
jgi:hypothetical protein